MTETKMEKSETLQPRASRLGFDNLLEDIFGLNIRALKTIWTTFSNPKSYFMAADDPDWMDRYTPSFRVWFGLLALYTVLRFIYGAEDSPMVEMYSSMYEEAAASQPNAEIKLDPVKAAQEMLKWTFVFFPFALIPFYALLAWIFKPFETETSFVLRFRYIFATVLPSTFLVLLSTFLMLLPLTTEQFTLITIVSVSIIFVVDWITGYRGTFARTDGKNRAGLSMVFAILLFISYVGASILAAFPASVLSVATSIERVKLATEDNAVEIALENEVSDVVDEEPQPEG